MRFAKSIPALPVSLKSLVVAAVALPLFGCSFPFVFIAPDASTGAGASASTNGAARVRVLERQLTRSVRPARGLMVQATLWDEDLLVVDAKLPQEPGSIPEAAEEKRERLQRWKKDYLQGQTSFTVLLELSNRPALEDEDEDVLVNPSKWNFALTRGEDEPFKARRVVVQAIDRFPTRAGGWHWRIAYGVHFDGAKPEDSEKVTLRVFPPSGDGFQPEYGHYSAKRGFPLTWRSTIAPNRPQG